MAEPYLGQITMFCFYYPPRGWAKCDGALLPLNQHHSLFALMGTAFGGDGRTTVGLPEMRGRVPLHMMGPDYLLGQSGGKETVTLNSHNMPIHNHAVVGTTAAGNKWGGGPDRAFGTSNDATDTVYHSWAQEDEVHLHDGVLTPVGGGKSHNNIQPSFVLNFCIALEGVYPPRQ